tara:strand:- start:1004 stop:1300 length:297 start_codon:yes stop_codon:yes gene_type:complete
MSYLNDLKTMIYAEPLTETEKDSLITKTEIILRDTENMNTNEKILNIFTSFKNLDLKDKQLVIDSLINSFNNQRKEIEESSAEELLRQKYMRNKNVKL